MKRWLHCFALAWALIFGATLPAQTALPPAEPCDPALAIAPQVHVPTQAEPEFDLGILPRFSARYQGGDGVGYQNGYTYLEVFLPVVQSPGESILFGNARIVNFMDGRYWEAQTGGGARWLLPNLGVVAGLNGFYDGRNTDVRWFNQMGFGWEVLGSSWEARGNAYFPMGTQRTLVGQFATTPRFVNTNITLDSLNLYEGAMMGFDIEVGHRLPSLFNGVRNMGYLGYYHYSGEGLQTANGIRGRLESWVGENLSTHLTVQNDAVFNTTVTGGLAVHWGGVKKGARQESPLEAKLGERVVRDPNVVLQRKLTAETELAIDPTTGLPIEVRHANSNAAPGGDGSVERPFNTLGALQTGSPPGAILFAHSGSVFNGQGIVLQANQRFLGEGIAHTFPTSRGTFLLPSTTGGTVLPMIQGAPGAAAITLASGTEVSGLHLLNSAGYGIQGVNIASVNVNRNLIQNSVAAGIILHGVGGQSILRGNTIAGVTEGTLAIIPNSGAGIFILASGTTQQQIHIVGNSVSNVNGVNRAFGIFGLTLDSASLRTSINRNSISGVAATDVPFGIAVQSLDSSTLTAQIANNTLQNLVGGLDRVGINATSVGSANLGLQLTGNISPERIDLINAGGSFRAEDTLGTNTPFPSLTGPIVIVPVGTFGFLDP